MTIFTKHDILYEVINKYMYKFKNYKFDLIFTKILYENSLIQEGTNVFKNLSVLMTCVSHG